MSIIKYIIRRLIQAVPTVWAVITLNFFIIHAAPGDPVSVLAGGGADPQLVEAIRVRLGLDLPLYVQYKQYIFNLLQGDLGYSYSYRQPVINLILERSGATITLTLTALILYSILGVWLALKAARKPYSLRDNATTVLAVIGWATPEFWLGQMLLILFAFHLGWFPVSGMVSIRDVSSPILDRLHHLFLPSFALGLRYLALTARFTRASLLEILGQDYIITARAKGQSEEGIYYKHALPNAILPVITMIGMYFPTLLMGSVLTEVVFGWPGIGRLMYDAIYVRDYPILLGIFFIVSIFVILVNLIIDLLYSFIDPRVRVTSS
jgi:ABC-type dipeptide/oligopeptide/nickel transport system permease component